MKHTTSALAIPALLAFGAALSPLAAQATHASHSASSAHATSTSHATNTAHASHRYRRNLPAALTKDATVSESDAAKTAEGRVTNGHIRAVELENENGRLIYSYDLKVPGKSGIEEVNVDAKTGEVVSTEHESAKAEKKEAAKEKKEKKETKAAKPTH